LLLHPFAGPAPKDHLEFGELGEIAPRNNSVFGFETIRTCGLNRPSLREQRVEKAQTIVREIEELATLDGVHLDKALERIHAAGAERNPFCGMVRAIYEQRTGSTWDDLAQLVGLST
jgi:hypothetical protein